MKKYFTKYLFCLSVLTFIVYNTQAEILLVNPAGAGGARLLTVNVADWTSAAYPSLQAALEVAVSGDQIWVKQGTYLPTKDATGNASPADNRTKTFKIPNGISLYGGFIGTETLLTARNPTTNVTILSGDIGTAGVNTDNSYNVVVITDNTTQTRLDGVTVEKGHDDRASSEWGKGIYIANSLIIIANCIVTNNIGITNGGAHKYGIGIAIMSVPLSPAPQVQILNSTISNNIGAGGGGGMEARDGTTLIRNCIFKDNSASTQSGQIGTGGAIQLYSNSSTVVNLENSLLINNVGNGTLDDGGGAIMIYAGTVNVSNCTIANNGTTGSAGGGIRKSPYINSNLTINNSIVFGNTSVNSVILNDKQVSPGLAGILTVNNNLFQCPLPAGASGVGNLNDNPRFVSATDFTLQTNSPCLNVGNNALIPSGITTDLVGNNRIFATTVDMGTYELQMAAVAPLVPSVSIAALPAGAICAGTSVTFTATPTNGGTIPSYQWKINGGNVGTNSATFTTSTLANGDIVTCYMTPSDICNTYPSNGITTVISIIYVRKDGNDANTGFANTAAGAKLTLQAAVTAVLDGCTIVLNAGTYNETATIISKSIFLQGVGNPTVQNIVMNGGAGKKLTLTGNLGISDLLTAQSGEILTGGNLTLLSSAVQQAMVANNGGTITGDVRVQRYVGAYSARTTVQGYNYFSSPISGKTIAEFNDNVSLVLNPAYDFFATYSGAFPNFYRYRENRLTAANDAFEKGWESPASLAENLEVGKGYILNLNANTLIDFLGTLNNSNIAIPISRGTLTNSGWNLVGNPYPATLDWDMVHSFGTNNTKVASTILRRIATGAYSGTWAYYNAGVGGLNGGTKDIALGQGFLLRKISVGNDNLDLTNAMRNTNGSQFFRTEETEEGSKTQGVVKIKLSTQKWADETMVYFKKEASEKYEEGLDVLKSQLNSNPAPNLYTSVSGKKIAFNAQSIENLPKEIPLHFYVASNGQHEISLSELRNFKENTPIYLEDKKLKTIQDLREKAYTFSANVGTDTSRFVLKFDLAFATEIPDESLTIYPNPATNELKINIDSRFKGNLQIRLTDVLGREISLQTHQKQFTQEEIRIDISKLGKGIYFVEVIENNQTIIKKIVKE